MNYANGNYVCHGDTVFRLEKHSKDAIVRFEN